MEKDFRNRHRPGRCMICHRNTNIRYKNLFVIGSEGLDVCWPCEKKILECVRELMNENMIAEKRKFINRSNHN